MTDTEKLEARVLDLENDLAELVKMIARADTLDTLNNWVRTEDWQSRALDR